MVQEGDEHEISEIEMENYRIATGRSRTETAWTARSVTWKQLIDRLGNVKRTSETAAEYARMSRADKGRIKDTGGFVGGVLRDGLRRASAVECRSIVTLDLDYARPDTIKVIEDQLYGTAWCVYSTHSHTPEQQRLRLIVPLSREVTPDEYVPVARKIADDIGIDAFDDSTYEPARLMYWPSAPRDGEWVFRQEPGHPLDPDAVLSTYDDWRDVNEWPVSSRVLRIAGVAGTKQEDPTTKPGAIGAFCRAHTLTDAIIKFLPDQYTQTGKDDRWTYAKGSTVGGLIIYDDKWAYSHHGTDPACGRLCNAFDLVRIHRFGTEDAGADPDTPANRLPSFLAMERFTRMDSDTAALMARERAEEIRRDFDGVDAPGDIGDASWTEQLQMDERRRNFLPSPYNFGLIIRNDPGLRGTTKRDAFRGRDIVTRDLPWRKLKEDPFWNNSDDAGLVDYISKGYQLAGKTAIIDARDLATSQNSYHPVRDYLNALPAWDGTPRLDTLLCDYLGAEDSEMVRAMTRKQFCAAVARVMEPGCKYDFILTLIGPEAIGKSSLIREMARGWFSDSLATIEGKEAMEQLRGKWLIEIGELTNYKKSTSEAYKAFVSKQEDSFRPAYGKQTEVYPRQCVFFATTNEFAFLKGDTGNRRFWTVQCGEDLPAKNVWRDLPEEVDQVWAEALMRWKEHEPLYLSYETEQQARKLQEQHNEVLSDDRIGIIEAFIRRPLPSGWHNLTKQQRQDYFRIGSMIDPDEPQMRRETITSVEILNECFLERLDDRTRYRTREINQILRNMQGLEPIGSPYNDCYGRQRTFRIIPENPEKQETMQKNNAETIMEQ